MKVYIISVNSKGQITLPSEVRALLGIKPRDKVVIMLDEHGEAIRVVPTGSGLNASYQAIPSLDNSLTFRQMRELAREEHAKVTLERMSTQ